MVKRLIWSFLLALTMRPGRRYHDWRWKYIARTRRRLDKWRCRKCGRNYVMLHAHHRRPVARGGNHQLWNLETLCAECHAAKHPRLSRRGSH